MKILLLCCLTLLLYSSYIPYYYDRYELEPILMSREVLENSVGLIGVQLLERPGKIYIRGNYLFINERYKGIHVIDNSNPEDPVNKGFIRIPGCIDMAAKGAILYADNAVDLVAIDLGDMDNIKVTRRVRNAFPPLAIPHGYFHPGNLPANMIIVEWTR